jgi:hypothetical protein
MQYDLNLNANGSQRLEVAGRFFKYTNGAGKIRVTTNKGAVIDLTVGQGVWGEEFQSLTVLDRSGATNNGVLLAGSYDFRDDTVAVSGTIDVGNVGADMYGASWFNLSSMAQGTAIIIVPAEQNVRGIKVHKVISERLDAGTRYGLGAYVGNPATTGVFTSQFEMLCMIRGDTTGQIYENPNSIAIPPGRSLVWVNDIAQTSGINKHVKYKVL